MRGFIFSTDTMIATGLLIILAMFLAGLSFTLSAPTISYQRMYVAGRDMINMVEDTELLAFSDSPVVQDYLGRGVLIQRDLDRSVLDAIGYLWLQGHQAEATNLSQEVFTQIVNNTIYSYEIVLDSELIDNLTRTADRRDVARLSRVAVTG